MLGGAEDWSFLGDHPAHPPGLADTLESTGPREESLGSHQDFFLNLSCLSLPQGGFQPSEETAGVWEVMVWVMSEDPPALGTPGPCSSLPQLPPTPFLQYLGAVFAVRFFVFIL